jgi:HlyD family secretion protein
MKRYVRRSVYSLVIIAVIGVVVYNVTQKKPILVTTHTVDRGDVESVVANTRAGTVKACRRAKLAPPSGGQIASLLVKEGDKVREGQILLELWNVDLVAQVKLAESEAAASRASAEQACLRAEGSEREAKRLTELKKKGLAADDAVDRAVTTSKADHAGCRAAKANSQVRTDQVAVARAALERTILKAPFSGSIAAINGEVGEYVTPSPPGIPTLPAIDIVNTSCLYILAPIDEVDAPAIRTEMPARISLDAFPGKTFKGVVRRIAPYVQEVEKQARTVDVEAEFVDPTEYKDLLPGYSADVEIVLDVRKNVLRIPTQAILQSNKVFVYQPDSGLLEEREIKTGLSNWNYTEVITGLKQNEQVVTSVDRAGVKAGAYVQPE